MKNITIYFLLLLIAIECSSQPIHLLKEKKYVRHWENYYENCCIHVIDTGLFPGVILDGRQLAHNDSFFLPIVNKLLPMDDIDSIQFDFCPASADIKNYMARIQTLSEVSLFPNSQTIGYFYQYVGLVSNNRKILLVNSQEDDSIEKDKRIQRKAFELFKLLYSRIFFKKPSCTIGNINDGFVLLYDINNDCIINLYY